MFQLYPPRVVANNVLEFRVCLPSCFVGTAQTSYFVLVKGTVQPEVSFAALWEEVGSITKSSLTFHLGQLAKAVARREDDSKLDVLSFIVCILLCAALRPNSSIIYEGHGTPFVAMLRDASIGTLLELKALAETKMTEDSDSMSWTCTWSTDIPDGTILEVPPQQGLDLTINTTQVPCRGSHKMYKEPSTQLTLIKRWSVSSSAGCLVVESHVDLLSAIDFVSVIVCVGARGLVHTIAPRSLKWWFAWSVAERDYFRNDGAHGSTSVMLVRAEAL